jgi:hypothetical protein
VPPSCGNVVNTPRITEEIASVSRIRYSPDSFCAGRHERAGEEREDHPDDGSRHEAPPVVITR